MEIRVMGTNLSIYRYLKQGELASVKAQQGRKRVSIKTKQGHVGADDGQIMIDSCNIQA